MNGVEVTLEDLAFAYRKVKADLFYGQTPRHLDLLEYEQHLVENLTALKELLRRGDHPPLGDQPWTLTPKGAKIKKQNLQEETTLHWSDGRHRWPPPLAQRASFRVMENLPIGFHVFSTLWITSVGQAMEAQLSKAAHGNRLRRNRLGAFSKRSLGTVKPYLTPYCNWRDHALKDAQTWIDAGKNVLALSTDIAAFYHSVDSAFLRHPSFTSRFADPLAGNPLHQLFVVALGAWAGTTPSGLGIPVGLAASPVIANLSLLQLDEEIEQQLKPLHYGRYVDDLIVLLEHDATVRNSADLWTFIAARCPGISVSTTTDFVATYRPDYFTTSLSFGAAKSTAMVLTQETGSDAIATLRQQINERASEWRALPPLPHDEVQVERRVLDAVQPDGGEAATLGKLEGVTVRRGRMALRVRDFETYSRLLPPKVWQKKRHAFLRSVRNHVCSMPALFDLYRFIPRCIDIAIRCGDIVLAVQLAVKVDEAIAASALAARIHSADPEDDTSLAGDEVVSEAQADWRRRVQQVICAAGVHAEPEKLGGLLHAFDDSRFAQDLEEVRRLSTELWVHDLASMSYKAALLPREAQPIGILDRCAPAASDTFQPGSPGQNLLSFVEQGRKDLKPLLRASKIWAHGIPFAFLFPTRPPDVRELSLLVRMPAAKQTGDEQWYTPLFWLRGYAECTNPPGPVAPDRWIVPYRRTGPKTRRIAIASFETPEACWSSAARGELDGNVDRMDRVNTLVTSAMTGNREIDYLVFPELSLPPRMFLSVARRLELSGISLVAGVEYLASTIPPDPSCPALRSVTNEVWLSLLTDSFGHTASVSLRQHKIRPALHEEAELFSDAGAILDGSRSSHPIYSHGGFEFAVLICSELSNIDLRHSLRGAVDALFVPEWNKDTELFGSLVEATSYDLHAFVVQCNNRLYGDTRIRSPAKKGYARDLVRLRGGIHDYFVVGEVDFHKLRKFQSSHRSSAKGPFKPVPDGFTIGTTRRTKAG